jgi:hypothetical protein
MVFQKLIGRLVAYSFIAILTFGCTSLPQDASSPYGYKQPSQDGIGKVYLGREISQVMVIKALPGWNAPDVNRRNGLIWRSRRWS